jgi:CCR4-NOT transcription complex subunit 7/8
MKGSKPVHLREVWADNLVYEFFLIKEAISRFPLVALDTEFPGTIFQLNRDKSSLSHATPSTFFFFVKF